MEKLHLALDQFLPLLLLKFSLTQNRRLLNGLFLRLEIPLRLESLQQRRVVEALVIGCHAVLQGHRQRRLNRSFQRAVIFQ